MSAGMPTLSNRELVASIKPFRRRVIGFDIGQFTLMFAAVVILCLVAAMWLDTVVALPVVVRWTMTRVGMLAALIAMFVASGWRGIRVTNEKVADRIDTSIGSGGEVLAGWQLANRPVHPDTDLSRGLAAMASQRAAERVRSVAMDKVVSWRLVQNAAVFLGVVLAAVSALGALVPGIAAHQMNRFLYPSADIPPYTGTIIELELEEPSVLYGKDAFATASVIYGNVDRLTLVVLTDRGTEQTLPMLAQNEAKWQAILTRVTEPLTLYARSGVSRSRMHRLDVQLTPQIMPPKVTITPPAYTRGSVYRGPIPDQGLIGLAGTRVDWEVKSNRPLASGTIRVSYRGGESETLELALRKDAENSDDARSNMVAGTMLLSQPGQFELSIVDVDGMESQERVEGSITVIEDRRPMVRIVQPQQLSLATPDVKLPVTVAADDDYGITNVTLFRSLNGSPSTSIEAEVDGKSRVQSQWDLPLSSFSLVPGDEIQLFARTEDNDPAGAKGAESAITTIRIISMQQFQEMMIQRKGVDSIQAKYQAARRYFDQLASSLREVEEAQAGLKQNPDSADAAKKLQEKIEAAQKAAELAEQEVAKLSEQPMPIDVDRELAKRLARMSQQAGKMAQQLNRMKEEAKPSLTEQDEKMVAKMIEQSKETQTKLTDEAIDPLKKMQQIMPLVVAQQRFVQITQQQRDLAGRLQSLRDTKKKDALTQRRIADLESEQEQLRQQLDQLLNDIQMHAQDLPDDPELADLKRTAMEFSEAVRKSDAGQEMALAQKNLLAGEFSDAWANADKAAEILESFLSRCEGEGKKACENCKAAFRPSAGGAQLGNSIEQMLAMMGMKPGASGMKPGGQPGMGMGFGAGGGYAQRNPGPQNVGLYGSMPMPLTSPSSGKGDSTSPGFQSSQVYDSTSGGGVDRDVRATSEASGQSMKSIPADYRSKVEEYFRNLNEALGNAEAKEGGF